MQTLFEYLNIKTLGSVQTINLDNVVWFIFYTDFVNITFSSHFVFEILSVSDILFKMLIEHNITIVITDDWKYILLLWFTKPKYWLQYYDDYLKSLLKLK